MPGIPDRMFGQADKSQNAENTETHKFLYLPVTNPITGRTWLNNNLGAEYARIASSDFKPTQQAKTYNDYKAYGSLFQGGRKADGHELMNWTSATEGTGANGVSTVRDDNPTSSPGFITDTSRMWRVNPGNTLWVSESGSNNVCPEGYRLPTGGPAEADGIKKEWETEVNSWNTANTENHTDTTLEQAFNSTLKLSRAGYRQPTNGNWARTGGAFDYWSGSPTGIDNKLFVMYFNNDKGSTVRPSHNDNQGYGLSVRCIKDQN
jgi:uncharacterized protein (TIGR02145 family)